MFSIWLSRSREGGASRHPGQGRLVVEEVDLAGTAVHEQVNDRFGLRLMVGSQGSQVEPGRSLVGARRTEKILLQKPGQGGAVDSVAEAGEEVPPGGAEFRSEVGHGMPRPVSQYTGTPPN